MTDLSRWLNKVTCCDCRDALQELPDRCVDLALVDPPYGVGVQYASFDDTRENVAELVSGVVPELRRVAKRVLITCGNGNQSLYPEPDWTLCWYIPGGVHSSAWGFITWEPILAYGKPYRRPGGGGGANAR